MLARRLMKKKKNAQILQGENLCPHQTTTAHTNFGLVKFVRRTKNQRVGLVPLPAIQKAKFSRRIVSPKSTHEEQKKRINFQLIKFVPKPENNGADTNFIS